jgi:hypothetical protein
VAGGDDGSEWNVDAVVVTPRHAKAEHYRAMLPALELSHLCSAAANCRSSPNLSLHVRGRRDSEKAEIFLGGSLRD